MTDLRDRVETLIPGVLDDLARLVAIPSISSLPEHHDHVEATAEAVAQLLTDLGCPDVRIVVEGGLALMVNDPTRLDITLANPNARKSALMSVS